MPASRTLLGLILLIVLATFAAGCQTKQEFWLNPDGSGKVILSNQLPPESSPSDVRSNLESMIKGAQGIEAWADPVAKVNDKGYLVSVTGYFKDFNKLSFQGGMRAKPVWTKNADGSGTLTYDLMPPASSGPAASQPSAAEIDAMVKRAADDIHRQMGSSNARDIMRSKQLSIYHLPGAAKNVNGFKTLDERTVQFEGDGEKVMAVMNKIADDPVTLRKIVEATPGGRVGPETPAVVVLISKELFGTTDPLKATTASDAKPQFDYAKQVAATKPVTADFYFATGFYPKDPPASKYAFTEIKLDQAKVSPFNPNDISYNFLGKLPAGTKALGIQVEYYIVQDGAGNYLLPGGSVTRVTGMGGSPLDDKSPVRIYFTAPRPASAKTMKRIMGVLHMGTYTSSTEEELGEIEVKTGATGKMGLKILDTNAMLSLQTDNPPGLGAIKFLDDKGAVVLTVGSSPSPAKQRTLFTNMPLPAKAKVVATVYKDYTEVDVPFDLKDIAVPEAETKPATRP